MMKQHAAMILNFSLRESYYRSFDAWRGFLLLNISYLRTYLEDRHGWQACYFILSMIPSCQLYAPNYAQRPYPYGTATSAVWGLSNEIATHVLDHPSSISYTRENKPNTSFEKRYPVLWFYI